MDCLMSDEDLIKFSAGNNESLKEILSYAVDNADVGTDTFLFTLFDSCENRFLMYVWLFKELFFADGSSQKKCFSTNCKPCY